MFNRAGMYFFHEIHCDDFLLEVRRDRATYLAAKTLMSQLIETAEARNQRLALRFRHPFAEAARAFDGLDNPLRAWELRGHEIGTHAHRRRIRRTRDAIDACGVQRNHCVVPGLIQIRRHFAAWTLGSCRNLGFSYVTDQIQFGAFAYAGLTPWRPSPDLRGPGHGPFIFADVSVNPFAWGMLEQTVDGVRQIHGLRDRHFDRLLALLDQHLSGPRPHRVCYFGYPFHEHQHCRSFEDLTPDEESLAAWDRFLGQALERAVTPALPREIVADWAAGEPSAPPGGSGRGGRIAQALDRRDLRRDGPSRLLEKWDPVSWTGGWIRGIRNKPGIEKAPWLGQGVHHDVAVGERSIRAWRWGPENPRAAVVVSVSGEQGGCQAGLSRMGLDPRQLGDDLAIWLWDRSAPFDPGSSHHGDDACAVFELASREGVPTGWLTWSAGILPALMCLDRTCPAFFVDVEAPADRRSLRRPQDLDPATAERTLHNDLAADDAPPEPFRLIPELPCAYDRVQADPDHVHGHNLLHAGVLLNAAVGVVRLNGRPWTGAVDALPGAISTHGAAVRRVLRSALPAAPVAQGESRH
jgi:hypothetical protein